MADNEAENKEDIPNLEDNVEEELEFGDNTDEVDDILDTISMKEENSDGSLLDNVYIEKRLDDYITYEEYLKEMKKLKEYFKKKGKKDYLGGDWDIESYYEQAAEETKEGYSG
uniref:Uncharacterized protein n=1 Tax=Cacopsylla melanoneura TaxID=428564 RepID=A0A8D9BL23_9HEMI